MTGSLKRHPSGDADESPKAKRVTPGPVEEKPESAEEKCDTEKEDSANSAPSDKAEAASFLSPPTKVGGFSITDKVNITDEKAKLNGNSNSIINSGFKLSTGASLFSNGNVESTSTNIFSAALANASSGGGIFGSSAGSSFVFGANLSDRVVSGAKEGEKAGEKGSTEAAPAVTVKEPAIDKLALVEAKVTSGEEDEKRIIQTTCKLYQFCPQTKSWVERGGGTLRLNEKESGARATSRLVIRSKAVMKVMLNTKIFPDMIINRANLTTIRISALDNGKMGTFLLKCTRNECDRLHTALLKRREIVRRDEEEFGGESSKSEENSESNAQKDSNLTAGSSETLDNEKTVEEAAAEDDEKSNEKVDKDCEKEDKSSDETEEKSDEKNEENDPTETADATEKANDEEPTEKASDEDASPAKTPKESTPEKEASTEETAEESTTEKEIVNGGKSDKTEPSNELKKGSSESETTNSGQTAEVP